MLCFCFGSEYTGYKGFDCIKEKIESVLKKSVWSKEILMPCLALIYRREISKRNNLHIVINSLYEYTATGESLEEPWKVKG